MSASRLSIRVKVALGTFVFAFLPLALLGAYMFQSGKRDILRATEQNLLSIIEASERHINDVARHDLDHVVIMAGLPRMADLALAVAEGGGDRARSLEEMRRTLGCAVVNAAGGENYLLLHPKTGEVLAATDPSMEGMFFVKRPYFEPAKKGPFIYRVHYSLPLERNIMAFAAPVRKGDRLVGVLLRWTGVEELERIVELSRPISSYLVNRANLYVIGADPARHGGGGTIRSAIFTEGATRALRGETGSGIYRDPEGKEVVGAFAHLETLDLALLAEVPVAELHVNINRLGRRILGAALALAVGALAVSVLVGRQIAGPIMRLSRTIQDYGEGREPGVIETNGGSAEVNDLTGSFNLMISQRADAIAALTESEGRFRALFDQATDCIHLLEPREGVPPLIVDANDASLRVHGYTRGELIGRPITDLDLSVDINMVRTRLGRIMAGEAITFEVEHKRKDGSTLPLEVSARRIVIGGRPFILSNERDITERRQAEERMRASLREKEVLLKEIHHRVKNNMQIISSLLKLQAGYAKDPGDADMFKESLDRIKSMALIHEKLYLSEDLSHINYREYLNNLAGRLIRHGAIVGGDVSLDLDVEDIELGIDTAIPAGLVINELISNSLKHAFGEGLAGRIKVSFRRAGPHEHEYEIRVKDDGKGLPEGFDPHRTNTMGMMLITSITEGQLKGALTFTSEGGAEFVIRFQDIEYAKRI